MRLDLVMRQNAAMAAGEGLGATRSAVIRRSRSAGLAGAYITWPESPEGCTCGAWTARVFLKSDPVWHRIYPPWEFNCNCDVEGCGTAGKGRR